MSAQQRSIAANTTIYTAALTIQKVLSFIYFSYLARSLGTELTGKYFFALSLAAIVMVFMDMGLTPVLTREASKNDEEAQTLLSHVLGLKVLLIFIVGVVTLIITPALIIDPIAKHLLYIALAIAAFDSLSVTFFAIIRAKQNLFYESLASVLFQVITLTLGSLAIALGADIRIVLMALFIASFSNMTLSGLIMWNKFKIVPSITFKKPLVKLLVMTAIPFALATVFVKVQAYIDTVMLKFILGDDSVGVYSVAYKITFAFQFVPLAFVAALYPAFSKYWHHERSQLSDSFEKAFEYLLIISLPIVFGISAIAHEIIPYIYTDAYHNSITPLIILLATLPFLFINFPVGALLNACSRQTRQMWHLGITMVVSIILNILLIPRFGPVGAALASSISTLVIFFLGMSVAIPLASLSLAKLLKRAIRIMFVGFIMFLAVIIINWYAPWILAVIVGAIVYPVALVLMRVVSITDIRNMKSLFQR